MNVSRVELEGDLGGVLRVVEPSEANERIRLIGQVDGNVVIVVHCVLHRVLVVLERLVEASGRTVASAALVQLDGRVVAIRAETLAELGVEKERLPRGVLGAAHNADRYGTEYGYGVEEPVHSVPEADGGEAVQCAARIGLELAVRGVDLGRIDAMEDGLQVRRQVVVVELANVVLAHVGLGEEVDVVGVEGVIFGVLEIDNAIGV